MFREHNQHRLMKQIAAMPVPQISEKTVEGRQLAVSAHPGMTHGTLPSATAHGEIEKVIQLVTQESRHRIVGGLAF